MFVTVSAPRDLEEVITGEQGLLSGDRRPDIIVDCSTVSAATSAAAWRALARVFCQSEPPIFESVGDSPPL